MTQSPSYTSTLGRVVGEGRSYIMHRLERNVVIYILQHVCVGIASSMIWIKCVRKIPLLMIYLVFLSTTIMTESFSAEVDKNSTHTTILFGRNYNADTASKETIRCPSSGNSVVSMSAPQKKSILTKMGVDATSGTFRGTGRSDRSCHASAESVMSAMSHGGVTLVDVRPTKRFLQSHIPFSISIQLGRLRNFPKSGGPIVIVGDGFEGYFFERFCSESVGHDRVSVLDGGIEAWVRAGGPLEGTNPRVEVPVRLSVRDFFPERSYQDWLVADIEERIILRDVRRSEKAVAEDSHAAAQVLRSVTAQAAEDTRVLIRTETGNGYDLIARAVRELDLARTFFLEGGRAAWRDFIAMQLAIQNRSERRVGEAQKCGPG